MVNKSKALKFVNKNEIKKIRKSILNDKFKYLTKEVIYSFYLKTSKCATTSNIQINEKYLDSLINTGALTKFISEDHMYNLLFCYETRKKLIEV
jgi:hypothetical protein